MKSFSTRCLVSTVPIPDFTAVEKSKPVNKLGGNIAPHLRVGDRIGDPTFVKPSFDPKMAARMSVFIDKNGGVRWVDEQIDVRTHGADVLVRVREGEMLSFSQRHFLRKSCLIWPHLGSPNGSSSSYHLRSH